MKAVVMEGQAPGGIRTKLADALPLDTPYLMEFFPVYACNFRCKYCIMSVNKRGFLSDEVFISLDLYKKCIDELKLFPKRVKVVRFSGIGEPLLHKNIVEMVKYASGIVDKVEILTNASLLTQNLSDSLIAAGLSRLFISIQGVSQQKYQEISGVRLDFDRFVNEITYYCEHKGKSQLHIKIIDYALDDRERFYEIFGNICDTIMIEKAGAIHPGVDYSQIVQNNKFTQFGLGKVDVEVCPQPFFRMQVNPDGKVVPCYSLVYPMIVGNANKESLYEIWNGEKLNLFRRMMLGGIKNVCTACANCEIIRHRVFPEDDLSKDVERLKEIYEAV